jgi:hypothetical protein
VAASSLGVTVGVTDFVDISADEGLWGSARRLA